MVFIEVLFTMYLDHMIQYENEIINTVCFR
jgi:hypothetical protein